ncbi:uncharacterized protein LOC113228188 isoform X6 [Hyposmocoma kahamanoa]|uniref:uncharacterized protein LOC113228188 isoform X6 n=1 Tax=Hyposmocoma kahamanoa TaxID=1477025 RepID=UPI000E6D932F|nr:uncharacterized protein LOC113228188 isoform X6 [Hyposmocoma kahamanoa]
MDLNCNYCHKILHDFKQYIFHLETIHKIGNYFVCPFESCKRTYDKKNRFKNHLTTCYNSNRNRNSTSCDNSINISNSILSEQSSFPSTNDTHQSFDTSPSNDKDTGNESFIKSVKSYLNIFVCNLYGFVSLPRSLIQTLIELVQTLIHNITSNIHETVNNEHIDATKRNIIVLEMILALPDIFKDYDTEYKRLKNLVDNEYYVAPVEVKIGTVKDRRSENNDVTMMLKERKLYMTPLRQTLSNFLNLPGVLSHILNYQQMLLDESNVSNGDVIRNVIQGSLWKELSANIDKDSIVIPLILYFDDFESGNALGSHAGEYKLGAVYISIATIPPEQSSRLENIFVTQVFYSKDRVFFGNGAIFNKLIEELKFLEEVGVGVLLSKGKNFKKN